MANATTKIPFSASTQGFPITIAATATPGTIIHQTSSSATQFDALYLWAFNYNATDVVFQLEYGAVTVPNNTLIVTIPAQQGLWLIFDGMIMMGSGVAGSTLAGFCFAGANLVTVWGYVMRTVP